MKIEKYTVQRIRATNFDIGTGWNQDIHVEFDANVDENEFKAIFDMLMTGRIPKEVKE